MQRALLDALAGLALVRRTWEPDASAALPHATARFLAGVGHMAPISHAAIVNEAIVAHLTAHH